MNTIEKISLTQPQSDKNWDPVHPNPSSSIAPYKIYNIGNNVPVKLTDFIQEIEDKMGMKANLDLMSMQLGDVASTHANIDETVEHFQYTPNTSVKEGISNFIDWYFKYQDILKKNNI